MFQRDVAISQLVLNSGNASCSKWSKRLWWFHISVEIYIVSIGKIMQICFAAWKLKTKNLLSIAHKRKKGVSTRYGHELLFLWGSHFCNSSFPNFELASLELAKKIDNECLVILSKWPVHLPQEKLDYFLVCHIFISPKYIKAGKDRGFVG